ncbi:MAG: PEP-CTERM sorting domain-containing protein [Verrucomicrobiota bacterium]
MKALFLLFSSSAPAAIILPFNDSATFNAPDWDTTAFSNTVIEGGFFPTSLPVAINTGASVPPIIPTHNRIDFIYVLTGTLTFDQITFSGPPTSGPVQLTLNPGTGFPPGFTQTFTAPLISGPNLFQFDTSSATAPSVYSIQISGIDAQRIDMLGTFSVPEPSSLTLLALGLLSLTHRKRA